MAGSVSGASNTISSPNTSSEINGSGVISKEIGAVKDRLKAMLNSRLSY